MIDIKALVLQNSQRTLLITKKHSPALLTGSGIAGGVVAAVLGAKATLKLEDVLDDTSFNVETAKTEAREAGVTSNKAVTMAYGKGGLRVAKLYAPAVSLGAASIVCILSAHNILHKRNVVLLGAYSTLERGFDEYRKRVENELGEDKEREFRYGNLQKDHEKKLSKKNVTDDEKKEAHAAANSELVKGSPYARIFDEFSSSWSSNSEQNKIFLLHQQNYLNDMLRARGHVFLNEVYDALGLERSSIGQLAGWVYDVTEDSPGDNYIDFGIFSRDTQEVRMFVNGFEKNILLDFNVDGMVYDLI